MLRKIYNRIKEMYVVHTIKRSGIFDRQYYLKNNLDVARSCMDPVKHYVRHGWRQGRNPNEYFNTKWYLKTYPDVVNISINPFYHYIKYGITENRKPSLIYSTNDLYTNIKNNSPHVQKLPKVRFELIDTIKIPLKNRYENKTVSIILPVYNAYECLEKLLESIYAHSEVKFELIAIDDKSTDERVIPLLQKYSQLHKNFKIILNSENLGFVKTVNRALSNTKNTDVVIINSDIEMPEGWLSRMFHPIWSQIKIASVTPMSNSATIMSFPQFGINNDLFEGMSLKEIDDEFKRLNPESNIYIETPTGHGFCMAMSMEAIEQIGLFDEIAFGKGYGEENDWCMRAKNAGFKNVIATNIFVVHHQSKSFGIVTRAKYIEKNLSVVNKRYPEYSVEVKKTQENIEYRSIRDLLLLILMAKHSAKTVLRFEHVNGGGSAFACFDYVKNYKIDTLCLVIRPVDVNKYILNVFYRDYKLHFTLESEDQISQLFDFFRIDKIIINQLVGYQAIQKIIDVIYQIKKVHNPIVEIHIRDFYAVCPEYRLMYMEKEFCKLNNQNGCGSCYDNIVSRMRFDQRFVRLSCWRRMWSKFFSWADTLVVYSNFTKSVIVNIYPEIEPKIKVSVISIDYLRKAIIYPHGNRFNIAVIGVINYAKGSSIVLDMVRIAKAKYNKEVKVFLFGKTFDCQLKHEIICKEEYQREMLPDMMEQNQIDIVFIPSIWGETFCRTAQEAIEMDIPVAVFNIGAPPERVGQYEKGLVIDKIDAEYALDRILEFIKSLRNPLLNQERSQVNTMHRTLSNGKTPENVKSKLLLRGGKYNKLEPFIDFGNFCVQPSDFSTFSSTIGNVKIIHIYEKDFVRGSVLYRVITPALAMQKYGIESVVINSFFSPEAFKEHLSKTDMVIFHRVPFTSGNTKQFIEIAKNSSVHCIGEIDDLLFSEFVYQLGPVVSQNMTYQEAAAMVSAVEKTMSYMNSFITSTHKIACVLADKYKKPVVTYTNKIMPHFISTNNKKQSKDIRLIFASGSGTHHGDFAEISRMLQFLLDGNTRLHLTVIGPVKVPDLMLSLPNVTKINCVSYKQMFEIYKQNDLMLIPLIRNEFNNAKSFVKYIEAGAVGIPVLASPTDEYLKIIRNGENGFLASNPDEWSEKIELFIKDKSLLLKSGQKAQHDVAANHTIDSIEESFINFIKNR